MNPTSLNTDRQVQGLATPKWIRLPQVINCYGLSRTKTLQLAKDGKITSVSLREPGMVKATRLFLVESLDSYIESFLPSGKEQV